LAGVADESKVQSTEYLCATLITIVTSILMMKTTEIPFISSLHGRKRRLQRGIAIRDLQSAVKYGEKEKGFPNKDGECRWKYTYGDVVYITDVTSTNEITSWALELPLLKVEISDQYKSSYSEAKSRIDADASIITSHTVLIVDMSASMNKSDMNGHRTRSRGAYFNIAEEMVAARLPKIAFGFVAGPALSFTDTFTLIEMRGEATTVFEREPLSWILFNRLVDLAELKDAHDHGNYLPALFEAFSKLSSPLNSNDNCALCLTIFSDGKPSDFCTYRGWTRGEILLAMESVINMNCLLYGDRLTFTAVGYGKSEADFDTLKMIVEAARRAGAKSNFGYSYEDDEALRSILSTTAASLTATRSMLSCLNIGPTEPRVRKITGTLENKSEADPENKVLYNAQKYEFSYVKNETTRMFTLEERTASMLPDAIGVAVFKSLIGEGAERLVYKMSEINKMEYLIGPALVVKESLYVLEKNKDTRQWHRVFVKTQLRAASLAKKFNDILDKMGVSPHIPRLKFLLCCVYDCQTRSGDQIQKAFLAEAQLNPQNYRKWNDNSGGIDGEKKVLFDDTVHPPRTMHIDFEPRSVGAIDEEEDKYYDDDDDDDDELDSNIQFIASKVVQDLQKKVLECDVPQAFSHFSHRFTKREVLVCDLQGELCLEGFCFTLHCTALHYTTLYCAIHCTALHSTLTTL
jgi:Alpha-kinase family